MASKTDGWLAYRQGINQQNAPHKLSILFKYVLTCMSTVAAIAFGAEMDMNLNSVSCVGCVDFILFTKSSNLFAAFIVRIHNAYRADSRVDIHLRTDNNFT